jgi:hypothetical protein
MAELSEQWSIPVGAPAAPIASVDPLDIMVMSMELAARDDGDTGEMHLFGVEVGVRLALEHPEIARRLAARILIRLGDNADQREAIEGLVAFIVEKAE